MLSSKWRRAALVVGMVGAACDPYTRSTVIQTRSASDVAIQDVDSPSRIPATTEATTAEVARTEVPVGPGSTSDLIVIATRRPSGEIVTEWQTRLPLINGERHTLLSPAGMAQLNGYVAIDTSSSSVTIPVCGTLQVQIVKGGAVVGYNVIAAQPCSESHMTQINMETPRTNIESIHHIATNENRGFAILGASVATIVLGGIGTIMMFADSSDDSGHPQAPGIVQRTFGGGLMGLGLAVDVMLFPLIFAPNKNEKVFP